jgi:hypothetical protein
MLTAMEEECHQRGAMETFRSLCRAMADGYRRRGMEPPLEQWYLQPATPAPVPGRPRLRETFQREECRPPLTWHDPTGASGRERSSRPGWLGLHPADHANLWPEVDLNAPRILAPLAALGSGADPAGVVAQTRVDLAWDTFAFAGLLFWQDEQHFVRLEVRRRPWEPAAVYMEAIVAGRFRQIGRGRWERRPARLRIERLGDEVRGLCSANGKEWWSCGSVRIPRSESEQLGIAAIADAPGGHAYFDALSFWRV